MGKAVEDVKAGRLSSWNARKNIPHLTLHGQVKRWSIGISQDELNKRKYTRVNFPIFLK